MKKIALIILILLAIAPFSTKAADEPVTVSGNDKYTLLEPLPCISGTGNNCVGGSTTMQDISLNTYIGYIYKFAIAIAAFLAIIMIIWGGFEYMTVESIEGKSDAKNKFKNAATGLLMVFASYLILRTIDPRLVEIETRLPAIKVNISDVTGKDGFSNVLAGDLKKLSAQDALAVQQSQNVVKTKSERLAEIQKIIADNEDSPTLSSQQMQDLVTEQQNLKSQIKSENYKVIVLTSRQSIGDIIYESLNIIDQKSSYPDPKGWGTLSDEASQKIDQLEVDLTEKLGAYAQDLRDNGNLSESQALESAASTLRTVIEEEKELMLRVRRNENTSNGQVIPSDAKWLKSALDEALDITSSTGKRINAGTAGVLDPIYNSIFKNRVLLIKPILYSSTNTTGI